MLSVAGTRWHKKSGAIIASPGEKCGLVHNYEELNQAMKAGALIEVTDDG